LDAADCDFSAVSALFAGRPWLPDNPFNFALAPQIMELVLAADPGTASQSLR
jgi:hypothetical protein